MHLAFVDYCDLSADACCVSVVVWDGKNCDWFYTITEPATSSAFLSKLEEMLPNHLLIGHKSVFLSLPPCQNKAIAVPHIYNPARLILAACLGLFTPLNGCLDVVYTPPFARVRCKTNKIYTVNLRNITCTCQPYSAALRGESNWCTHIFYSALCMSNHLRREIIMDIIQEFTLTYSGNLGSG